MDNFIALLEILLYPSICLSFFISLGRAFAERRGMATDYDAVTDCAASGYTSVTGDCVMSAVTATSAGSGESAASAMSAFSAVSVESATSDGSGVSAVCANTAAAVNQDIAANTGNTINPGTSLNTGNTINPGTPLNTGNTINAGTSVNIAPSARLVTTASIQAAYLQRIAYGALFLLFVITAATLAYLQSIPNYINRAGLTYVAAWPFLLSLAAALLVLLPFGRQCRSGLHDRFGEHGSITGRLDTFGRPFSATSQLGMPGQGGTRQRYGTAIRRYLHVLVSAALAFFAGIFAWIDVWALIGDFVPYGSHWNDVESLGNMAAAVGALLFIALLLFFLFRLLAKLTYKQHCQLLPLILIWQILPLVVEIAMRAYALGKLPVSDLLFSLLAELHNHKHYFLYAGLLSCFGVIILNLRLRRPEAAAYGKYAAYRKALAEQRQRRRLSLILSLCLVIAIGTLTFLSAWLNRDVELSPPEAYELRGKTAVLQLDALADMHLHRFAYEAENGNIVRFIAIQKSKGSYAVMLDACEVCGASGYYERDDQVVCKLCGVVMNRGTLGFKGGCNPIPLEFKLVQGAIEVDCGQLETQSYMFR